MAREFTAVDDLVQHQAALEIIDKGVPQHLALLTRNVHVGRQHVLEHGGDIVVTDDLSILQQMVDFTRFLQQWIAAARFFHHPQRSLPLY